MRIAITVFSLLLLGGCATSEPANTAFYQMEPGSLPATNITLNIPGLTPCTDNPDHSLHLKLSQPVDVLVHGCFGSSGQFRGLAQVLAFHGQQTVCFTYDDRARLAHSATQLRRAIDLLVAQASAPQITVIGHSQGALIAHKSLTALSLEPASRGADLRLVTISGPFSGIAAAQTCGRTWLYPLTLACCHWAAMQVRAPNGQISRTHQVLSASLRAYPASQQVFKDRYDERGHVGAKKGVAA